MKSTCKKSRHISAFIDAELPEHQMETFRSHLAACDQCRKQLSMMQQADLLLHGMPEIEPSRQFEMNFWKKIQAVEEKKRRWSWPIFFQFHYKPMFAAALTAMLLVGFVLWNNRPPSIEMDEMVIAENLELFQNFQEIDHLELLENWDTIMHMDERS